MCQSTSVPSRTFWGVIWAVWAQYCLFFAATPALAGPAQLSISCPQGALSVLSLLALPLAWPCHLSGGLHSPQLHPHAWLTPLYGSEVWLIFNQAAVKPRVWGKKWFLFAGINVIWIGLFFCPLICKADLALLFFLFVRINLKRVRVDGRWSEELLSPLQLEQCAPGARLAQESNLASSLCSSVWSGTGDSGGQSAHPDSSPNRIIQHAALKTSVELSTSHCMASEYKWSQLPPARPPGTQGVRYCLTSHVPTRRHVPGLLW